MLQMRSFLADIPRTAQPQGTNPLRDGSFHAGSPSIERFEFLGLGALASTLEGFVVQLATQGDASTLVPSGVRTQRAAGTGLAVFDRELDRDDLILAVIESGRPTETGMAFGTRGLLGVPVNVKLTCREARLLLGLPAVISSRGSNQINSIVFLALVQQLGINVAGIHQMLRGLEVLVLEPFVDTRGPGVVRDGSGGRFHMGDQMGTVLLAGFRQMHLLPHPTRRPLFTVVRIQIIGGADVARRRWQIVCGAPGQLALGPLVVLHPHLP